MKIIHIIPGFGGTFYCGNCLRDRALVQSLRSLGHDALTVPMYLPLTTYGTPDQLDVPVFYGAVNIYLKQKFPVLRNMPGWMERLFNSRPVLHFASSKAGSTRATGLEEMTISMLMGSEGYQKDELFQLVEFLKSEQPDIVHLSNALLLGMAKEIRNTLGVPVVYSLQDEDVWVDVMKEPYREQVWGLMRKSVQDVDAFIAVSHYFAHMMKQKMHIPDEKIFVNYIGVNPADYTAISTLKKPPAIGFLSRMSKGNGFEIVIDAFMLLKSRPEFKSLKLCATGGITSDDKPFVELQMKKLGKQNLLADVEIISDFRQDTVHSFFQKISILSVPVLKGEAFGLYQIEALASGVPLVQPAVGAFPEVIEATGGGVIYHPNTAEALADKLAGVLTSPEQLEQMSKQGIESVNRVFHTAVLAEKLISFYQSFI